MIAYSKYLDSFIKPYLKITNRIWYFTKCDSQGNRFGNVMRAGSQYDYFEWMSLTDVEIKILKKENMNLASELSILSNELNLIKGRLNMIDEAHK